MSRLKKKYKAEIRTNLQQAFSYENPMLIPELKKVVISMGLAEASKDKNAIQDCVNELTVISGQKPVITRARVSIANFKLREDQVIGAKVTLRGAKISLCPSARWGRAR